MTPQEIIENNTLLAEFMGWDKGEYYLNLRTGNFVKKDTHDCDLDKYVLFIKNGKPITQLFFHEDWNWLMLVVEKIYNMLCYDKYVDESSYLFTDGGVRLSINKKNVYTDCVDFVKWYNQNKGGK